MKYELTPRVSVDGDFTVDLGYATIAAQWSRSLEVVPGPCYLAIECYPGVNEDEIRTGLDDYFPGAQWILTRQLLKAPSELRTLFAEQITEDRVFGKMSEVSLEQYFCPTKLAEVRAHLPTPGDRITFILGTGASLVKLGCPIVYADMPRWEIQLRMRRREIGNWGAENPNEEFLRKYKQAYFLDWRAADKHKKQVLPGSVYYLDTTIPNQPKMISTKALREGLRQTVSRPFRVVPFFDPGPWGGQWMREKFDLDSKAPNFAWCFDCVPEENSLLLDYSGVLIEIPSINVVFFKTWELLGASIQQRFGAEFPIRFDMLDTMGGGNLSLQVHPSPEYIREQFGMDYTQDESYYLLDAAPGAEVFLGLRDDADVERLWADLEGAAKGHESFNSKPYVNAWPAKKHDHFLIPSGTIHCSGANSMVLEISATPYIFTFKLWDWGRMGLDGLPRPVHLDHGKKNLRAERRTKWVKDELVNHIEVLDQGDGWIEERTGLHASEFIETHRHWFTKTVRHDTHGTLNVINLIEGEGALVESPTGAFAPFEVHYAETFIVPAQIGVYTITPRGNSERWGTLKAFVRVSHD